MVLPARPSDSGLPRLKSLYVRESYEQLTDVATDGGLHLICCIIVLPDNRIAGCKQVEMQAQLVHDLLAGSGKDLLVTGSPGTGKSTWQLHLLQRLASTRQTVVVDWANVQERLLFCP